MKNTKLFFKAVLLILKNATLIIPLIEGMIDSVYQFNHPQKELKDVGSEGKSESEQI